MVAVDPVLAILEELQVISPEQRARGGRDLDALLDLLSEEPAWWSSGLDGDPCPTLTAHQIKVIRKHLADPRQLRANLRVGDYLVLRQIGKGGMGLVYQGWDLPRRRFVALKRMRRDGSRVLIKRFRKERRVLQKLKHPHIVRLLEYLKGKRSETLVMQYLRGHTLDKEITARGRVPWEEVVQWAIQLLDALQYAHARNVIHRDIKPTNLMLHRKGTGPRVAILLDVGLAKNLDLHGDEVDSDSVSLIETQAGQLLGTFQYMPPEQWSGKPVFASDVYSLGATLFHALTGQPPFTGKEPELGKGDQPNYVRMCRAHNDLKPPRLRERCPDLPEELDHLINAMLEKDAPRRAPIELLVTAFRRLLTRPEEKPVASPPRKQPVRPAPARAALPTPEEAPLPAEDEPNDSLGRATRGLLSAVWGYVFQERDTRPSTIFATPAETLRRAWRRFKVQASDWVVSLSQPMRYPGRWAVVLGVTMAVVGGVYWLVR